MYPYVYVNQDGTARELSLAEQEYLSKTFSPFDGGRPYVKRSFEAKDGWGSISGYLRRMDLPASIIPGPVNPDYLPPKISKEEMIADHQAVGDILTINPNGFSAVPNPNLTKEQRFELFKKLWLERQARNEKLALQQ